jgi:hypothetical protein
MWNLSSADVQQAKDRIKHRRDELEARYAEERKGLDADEMVIETLERTATEFASKYAGAEAAAAPTLAAPEPAPTVESAVMAAPEAAADFAAGPGDAKHGSRWRLHLGGRPEGEGQVGAVVGR